MDGDRKRNDTKGKRYAGNKTDLPHALIIANAVSEVRS
jgi:hypothetical protein